MGALLLHGLVPAQTELRADAPVHQHVPCDGFTALTSTADDLGAIEDLAPDALADLALRHNAILLAYCPDTAVMPMRFGAAFSTTQMARAQLNVAASAHRKSLATLTHLREYTVWLDVAGDPPRSTASPASGRDFLAQKRSSRDLRQALGTHRMAVAQELLTELEQFGAGLQQASAPKPGRLLGAALLIPTKRIDRLTQIATRTEAKAAPLGLALAVTGPWPAYSFDPTAHGVRDVA